MASTKKTEGQQEQFLDLGALFVLFPLFPGENPHQLSNAAAAKGMNEEL